ncbi:hypothetical protein RDV64_14580 [Acuticoccus sp. MNP-M23]|uniref:hypothetical protein n=1 Tax=Acuticoccus sp. MNP-M23 TaxID=3072793 RepID=UPI0028160489|nr:hypothetical protein [Acuticoccus sp. MNP-M23]WMS41305.1 hypothetical protein RDV64_14580 [Acuticoccus sp. MNP-M23]
MHGPESLVVDLVEWVARGPRAYTEVMDAWRTSCPRLPVWEDAMDRGLVRRERSREGVAMVRVTADGLALLADHGKAPHQTAPARTATAHS